MESTIQGSSNPLDVHLVSVSLRPSLGIHIPGTYMQVCSVNSSIFAYLLLPPTLRLTTNLASAAAVGYTRVTSSVGHTHYHCKLYRYIVHATEFCNTSFQSPLTHSVCAALSYIPSSSSFRPSKLLPTILPQSTTPIHYPDPPLSLSCPGNSYDLHTHGLVTITTDSWPLHILYYYHPPQTHSTTPTCTILFIAAM